MKFWQKQKCRHSVVLLLLLATTTIATATMAPIMWMSLSVSADTMSNLCVKTIVEHGSRLDRLIYGVGALVHHAVCFEQKRGRFRVCPTRHYCHVIVSLLLVISIVVVVVVVELSSNCRRRRCHHHHHHIVVIVSVRLVRKELDVSDEASKIENGEFFVVYILKLAGVLVLWLRRQTIVILIGTIQRTIT